MVMMMVDQLDAMTALARFFVGCLEVLKDRYVYQVEDLTCHCHCHYSNF